MDAERNQLQLRETVPDSAYQSRPIPTWQGEIDYGQSDFKLTRCLEQRNFIAYNDNRLKLSLEEAAYSFHQAKMPICQERTTHLFFLVHRARLSERLVGNSVGKILTYELVGITS